jgi:putative membrane protein (TIGR04086 family)
LLVPLRQDIATLNWTAVLLGLAAGVGIYIVASIPLNLVLTVWSFDQDSARLISLGVPLVAYLGSGFVAGRLADRTPVLHGAILGFLAVLVYFALNRYIGGDWTVSTLARVTAMAVIACTVAAWIGGGSRDK